MYDMLLKNGTIVDGNGGAPYIADVAIADGKIAAIGSNLGDARETVDVIGKLVTPGFIDPHTHYDGQVTWDRDILPSSQHGVTTAIIGSCGIGFAPVRKGSEDWLIKITEGVEDIPGSALSVGIPWNWETFPEYLDAIEARSYKLDIAAHVPHSALRAYVMGQRAEHDEPATAADIAEMQRLTAEGIKAGAVGFATSRVTLHRGSDGSIIPGTTAAESELLSITEAMAGAGGGVLQIIPSGISGGAEGEEGVQMMAGIAHLRDKHTLPAEIEMMRRIHGKTGQPVTFTIAESLSLGDAAYDRARAIVADAHEAGERVHPQYSPRPVGGLITLDTYHPFTNRPTYMAMAELPKAERAARLADPAVKAAVLSEADIIPVEDDPFKHIFATLQANMPAIYDLSSRDYEPDKSRSMTAIGAAEGRDALEVCYDALIVDGGEGVLIWFATGYADGDLRRKEQCIADPGYIMGLGDGGAHVQFICDASFPTFLLTHWGRDRTKGRTFPVGQLVRKLTADVADLYGFTDRGRLAVGLRADVNVIDFAQLSVGSPKLIQDLPADAKRFMQDSTGYTLTLVGGIATRRDDCPTAEYPGKLVRRGPRADVARGEVRQTELAG